MSKFVRIEELFNNPNRWENPEQLFIQYLPDESEYVFKASETGTESDQKMVTEDLGGWHPILRDGIEAGTKHVDLISHEATKFQLTLKGEIGWYNSAELVDDALRKCYSSSGRMEEKPCTKVCGRGCQMSKPLFNNLSDWLKATTQNSYYLGGQEKCKPRCEYADTEYYLLVVKNGIVYRHELYSKSSGENSSTYAIRTHIVLPGIAFVDVENDEYDGTTPEKALRTSMGIF